MKQIKDALLNNIYGAKCLGFGPLINKIMKIIEVFPDDPLLEASLKKSLKRAAAAGALGTGLLYGYGAGPDLAMTSNPNTVQARSISQPDDSEDLAQFKMQPIADPEHAGQQYKRKIGNIPDPEQAGSVLAKVRPGVKPADTHANFPPSLWHQPKVSGEKKMQSFVFTFDPLIDKANNKILADRRYLLKITDHRHHMDDDEQEWLDKKLKQYSASNVAELLTKMDMVPKGMALAQGALESGWGSSSLARQGNAFFGMISGPTGFSSYKSPQDSVTDYIHNLNTHPAYKEFRQARAQARANRQKLNSWQLIGYLSRYSERGQAYINHVKDMMSTPYIKDLDENRLFSRY